MKYYALMKMYSTSEGWCLFGGWDNSKGAIFTDEAAAYELYREKHALHLKCKVHPVELWEVKV